MFSGLVREIATIKSFKQHTLEVLTPYPARIGDSIAINGACLTAMRLFAGGVAMELSEHTRQMLAIENYAQGARVHLEPALQVGDRLDGHIVQGHIDGIGEISKIVNHSHSSDFWIETNQEILSLAIPKGSICVEGISLTIVERTSYAFKLTLIPHTLKNTLFGEFALKRRVNIESDVITRSVLFTLRAMKDSQEELGWRNLDSILLSY